MAQGQIKKPKAGAAKISQRKQTGSRVIKPKKTALIRKDQMKKKHSAGLTAATEKSLASKAGHLEMLRGGKKEKLENVAAKKPNAASAKSGK